MARPAMGQQPHLLMGPPRTESAPQVRAVKAPMEVMEAMVLGQVLLTQPTRLQQSQPIRPTLVGGLPHLLLLR